MAIFNLYSKRQKKLRGEVPDVYVYDEIPQTLRAQIVHIWIETLGRPGRSEVKVAEMYEAIVDVLCREYGVFGLPGAPAAVHRSYFEELVKFFLTTQETDEALDVIEITFQAINHGTRDFGYMTRPNASETADAAIEELNARFQEHAVGYQFAHDEIIRVDSELIHSEVVRPALRLLSGKHYEGAQQEFLCAHEHYRSGNTKEALNECLKAFESLMKSICDKRKWKYKAGASAKELIQVCMDNDLVPPFWQSVPTGRNKLSGHGQGTAPTTVPNYLAAYMLHMTASAIVFLAEAEANLP